MCTFQPGNFTGWGSEGVNVLSQVRKSSANVSKSHGASMMGQDKWIPNSCPKDHDFSQFGVVGFGSSVS